jgi:hypothetical protein
MLGKRVERQGLVPGQRVADRRAARHLLVAEVLVSLAKDTTVYFSRREKALKVNQLNFIIRASDSSWHPGLPRRPLFQPSSRTRIDRGLSHGSGSPIAEQHVTLWFIDFGLMVCGFCLMIFGLWFLIF